MCLIQACQGWDEMTDDCCRRYSRSMLFPSSCCVSGLRTRPGCFTFADCRGRVTNDAGSLIYIPTAYMSSVFPCVLFVYIHCIQIAMLEYFFHILFTEHFLLCSF